MLTYFLNSCLLTYLYLLIVWKECFSICFGCYLYLQLMFLRMTSDRCSQLTCIECDGSYFSVMCKFPIPYSESSRKTLVFSSIWIITSDVVMFTLSATIFFWNMCFAGAGANFAGENHPPATFFPRKPNPTSSLAHRFAIGGRRKIILFSLNCSGDEVETNYVRNIYINI